MRRRLRGFRRARPRGGIRGRRTARRARRRGGARGGARGRPRAGGTTLAARRGAAARSSPGRGRWPRGRRCSRTPPAGNPRRRSLECQAMRRIGIDARKLADYGIGSYLQGLLGEFARIDPPGGMVVFVGSESRHLVPELPESWRLVEVNAPGYSLKEQAAVLTAAVRARVGVLHVPHYVLPWLLPRRMVVTVHDIIHVLFPEFLPSSLGRN